MESFKLTLVIISLLCISSLSSQHEPLARKNGIVRHKKKMVSAVKKPLRPQQQHPHQQERPARRSNYGPRDPSQEEFVATSEHPSVSWKPITYAVYSNSPLSTPEPTESTVVAVSEKTDKPQPRQHEDQVTDQNQEYTLYQYYIPFEQLITHSKPIIEHSGEPSKESLNLDKINKAGVEPVTVFKKDNEGEASSSHSENDNEFTGRYEYEYFVQDDHWGTNFGHKEYRDEKYTKGDYEVVLPDGRVQHVKYWSDATGYHASVTYHPLYQKYKHRR